MTRKLAVAAVVFFATASAFASWYDDYDAGMKAVRAGQWSTVIQKMTAAIAGQPKENNNARTYGAIFINYHPYYYRGLAYLRTGKYEQAISDFEKTSGPGEVDRGSIDTLMAESKTKLNESNTPEPQPQPAPQPAAPQPQPVRPVVPAPQPAAPTIDEALRQQVSRAIDAADSSVRKNSKASASPQYQQAVTGLMDARTRLATAKSNDELSQALAIANNAKTLADIATPPAVATTPTATTPTKAQAATSEALGGTAAQVRRALEVYFRGDFDQATAQFSALSGQLPKNGWIFAFLGASQYSMYAFEGDEAYRTKAIQSFKKAKSLSPNRFKNGLPRQYFSRRIRNAFDKETG
jgi:tetratricopeptide (TPR) repeat protein